MTNHDKWWQRNNYIIPQKGVFSITLKNILVVSSISDLTLEFCVIFIYQVFIIWAKLKKFPFKIFIFGQKFEFWVNFGQNLPDTHCHHLSPSICHDTICLCHDKSWQIPCLMPLRSFSDWNFFKNIFLHFSFYFF